MPNPPEWDAEAVARAVGEGVPLDWPAIEAGGRLSAGEIQAYRAIARLKAAQDAALAGGPGLGPPELPSGYEILEELGRGTFARVYRARDRALEREVALKVLRRDAGLPESGWKRFLEEARALASLDHPNIVRVHGVEETEHGIVLALELVQGQTLEEWAQEHGPVSAEEAARIGGELCKALAAIHGTGLLHGDVKPANVMLADDGRVVLLDFGVAGSLNDAAGPARQGTPLFMAPEQLGAGEELTAAVDEYALGVLLYWLVSGHYPFESATYAELREKAACGDYVPLQARVPEVPRAFADIVQRALRVEPGKRFGSTNAFGAALAAFRHGQPGVRSRPRVPRAAWVAPIAAGLLLLVLFLGGLPPLGGTGSDFDFEVRMFVHRDGQPVLLQPMDAVSPGDLLFVHFWADRPVYFYLFNEDAAGSRFSLFPLETVGADNPLEPVPDRGWIGLPDPSDPELCWEVSDGGGGMEEFVFVLAEKPFDPAEELRGELPEPGPESEGARPVELSSATRGLILQSRGVGGLKKGPEYDSVAMPQPGEERLADLFGAQPLRLGLDTGSGAAVRVLRLVNRP